MSAVNRNIGRTPAPPAQSIPAKQERGRFPGYSIHAVHFHETHPSFGVETAASPSDESPAELTLGYEIEETSTCDEPPDDVAGQQAHEGSA